KKEQTSLRGSQLHGGVSGKTNIIDEDDYNIKQQAKNYNSNIRKKNTILNVINQNPSFLNLTLIFKTRFGNNIYWICNPESQW
ncbi:hypothetical protein NDJ33_19610, partial [Acinetobacter baumannii]|nr:hypothetical protein [Acinetobacter baumannii]